MNANPHTRLCLLALAALSLFPSSAQAQIVNGSFEQDGEFSFEGWHNTRPSDCKKFGICPDPASDAPPDGGDWSLLLWQRSYQGDMFNVVYQRVQEVHDGEIWRASAWVKQPPAREGYTFLYWTTFEPAYDTTGYPGSYLPAAYGEIAYTDSREWELLAVVDTFAVAAGDSVGVVLDAGHTIIWFGEPYSLFDLVSADRLGVVSTEPEAFEGELIELLPPSPNPVRGRTVLTYRLAQPGSVRLAVYDALGREVARLAEGPEGAGYHTVGFDASSARLGAGIYLLRLEAVGAVRTRRMAVVR